MNQARSWRPVQALCISQILSWGSLYYAFGILQQPIGQEMGWSSSALMGAFSLGLLVTGLATFGAGLLLRRASGRQVMTAGSVLSGFCLAALAGSRELWQFYCLWAIAGVAMGATLYETAFAVLALLYDADYKKAVTMVTLAGGLASTVFWPFTEVLTAATGWRTCFLIYALLQWAVCAPLHWLVLPAQPPPQPTGTAVGWRQETRALVRRPAFRWLSVSFMVHAIVFSALSVHLVPLLQARGLSLREATWMAALAGPVQVLGRALEFRFGEQWPIARTGNLALLLVVGALLLLWSPTVPAVALAVVVALYGASNGVMTIVRGVSIREQFGAEQYAAASGALMGPAIVCRAAGPLLASLLVTQFAGYFAVIAGLTLLSVVSWFTYVRGMNRP
jgi:predicted MFS family arabinose efflux permease